MNVRYHVLGWVLVAAGMVDAAAQPAPSRGGEGESDIASLRARLENGMAVLGELGNAARRQSDLVQATCVLDANERAAETMEIATSELLVLGDASADAAAQAFALEKLRASAERLEALVSEARRCATGGGPEATEDDVSVDVISPRSIPLADPTEGLGTSPIPPTLDGGWVPTASPME